MIDGTVRQLGSKTAHEHVCTFNIVRTRDVIGREKSTREQKKQATSIGVIGKV